MKKISKFLLFLLAFSPAFAFAGPFDPPPTDISVLVLNQIFGGLLQGGQNAFGDSIKTFNSIILSLGGILAAYTILAGTLGTAHDGEMLGKKFSSVWIPIRYSLGTALVLPVIPGGYCVMQQIVMWLVLQGVGLADIVWTSYVGAPIGDLTARMNASNKQNVLKFAEHVALAAGCTYAGASVYNPGNSIISSALQPLNAAPNFSMSSANGKYYYGNQATVANVIMNGKKDCGEITLPGAIDSDTAKYYGTVASSLGSPPPSNGKLGAINTAFATPSTEDIYKAHLKSAEKVIKDLNTAAEKAVSTETAIPYSTVVSAAEEYIKSVESVAVTYASGSNNSIALLKQQSAQQGWFLAGAWYTRLTMLNYHIQQSVNKSPAGESSTSLGSKFNFLDTVNPLIEKVQSEILLKNGQTSAITKSEKDEGDSKEGEKSTNSLINKLLNSFTGIDIKHLQNNDKPPVIILQEAGDSLIDMWETTMIALLGGSVLALLIPTATPIFITIIGFIAAPAAALVGIGFTLGYMLPNLPFLMWIGVILGWLIMVIEAVLAAPLWAIMHLHPNGDDLTGKGANGYMLVLGLTLRPVLTIFGLIAALVVTDLMGEFVNKIFFSVFQIGNATGIKGFLVIFFSFSIYTMSQFSLFKKTFSLMHVIPDQLLRWIGGGGEQLGQYAGSIADGAGRAQGAIAAASSFAGEKAVSSLGNAINQTKQIKDNKDNKALAEKSESLQLNNKFGDGAAEQANATIKNGARNGAAGNGALGWIGKQNNNKMRADKAAYNSGLERSAAAGGQDGVEEYQQGMEEASQNGYAAFGGTIEGAARGVAANVEQNQLERQVSNFNSDGGSEASAFMQKVAGTSDGKLDAKRAAPALSLLNQGREVLGSAGLSNVLEQASSIPDRSKAREFVQRSVAEAKFAKANKKQEIASVMAAQAGDDSSSTISSSGSPTLNMDPTTGLPIPSGEIVGEASQVEPVGLNNVANRANNGVLQSIVSPPLRDGDNQ